MFWRGPQTHYGQEGCSDVVKLEWNAAGARPGPVSSPPRCLVFICAVVQQGENIFALWYDACCLAPERKNIPRSDADAKATVWPARRRQVSAVAVWLICLLFICAVTSSKVHYFQGVLRRQHALLKQQTHAACRHRDVLIWPPPFSYARFESHTGPRWTIIAHWASCIFFA